MSSLAVCYCVHDDAYYLAQSIASYKSAGKVFAFVSRIPWHGEPGGWEETARIAEEAGATVVLGDWPGEDLHRQSSLDHLRSLGFTHALTPDGDEIIESELLSALIRIAEHELADRVYIRWDTYWKSPEYVIRPREQFAPLMVLDLRVVRHMHVREYEGGRPLLLGPEYGLVHHLSYAGPEERIRRKTSTWGHREEIVPGWHEEVWRAWDSNRLLRDLHPTHPPAYGLAERIAVPDLLLPALARYRKIAGNENPAFETPPPPDSLEKVSIIIPLYGGADDLRACLQSLADCRDLIREVIVADDASPVTEADDAPSVVQEFDGFVRLISLPENRGFSAACNAGAAEAAPGSHLLFLNSDAIVPRAGLVRLIESVDRSGAIGAAGPYTNYAGHHQRIEPTYTSLDNMSLFAYDFAHCPESDRDADMLSGFCLLVRRSVWDEIRDGQGEGLEPQGFDERFGRGLFEDNDLSYRIRRAGYRLVLSAQSFVHHSGSKTLSRLGGGEATNLFRRNERLYLDKWKADIESGYASHLSGTGNPAPIVFDQSRHPDLRARRIADLARRADISLCMIVRNEERVLADCLESFKPFFSQIVLVDTGSTDATREIAARHGAEVHEIEWPDSFAEARNESLKHAKGKWIFWTDADDTLSWASGEALLQAALEAPPETVGFVVPVQFVEEDGSAGGTRVDHVKLFRNLPGLKFEGRIHEQILPSLRAASNGAGSIARCGAVVLHSGYDTSTEGQARKRERDLHLLALDIAERPGHPFVLFNLGMTYHYMAEHETAIDWLRQCLAASPPGDSHVRKAYALLAVSLRESQGLEPALQVVLDGLAVVPGDPELHFHAGHLLAGMGRGAEAKAHYLRTLDADIDGYFSSVDTAILGYKTWHNLAGACLLAGSEAESGSDVRRSGYEEAKGWWLKAVDSQPSFLPSVQALFQAALEIGDYATAHRMTVHAHSVTGSSEAWAEMAVRLAEKAEGKASAENVLHQAIAREPEAVGPRLVLSRRLLNEGNEREALPHLKRLAAAGVAESAYFLGVSAIRHGNYPEALEWMGRALELNPGHEETRRQADSLRAALSNGEAFPDAPPAFLGEQVSMEEACRQVAEYYGMNAGELLAYAEEDGEIGGYDPNGSKWRGGSVWEVEGRMLYALVRALRPETIVEIGSLHGCSASHMAAACLRNGFGTVYAVDPCLDFSRVDPGLMTRLVPVRRDFFEWELPERIDFVFEDGAHEKGFTGRALKRLAPNLPEGAAVFCHDIRRIEFSAHLPAEFAEAMGGGETGSALISPADCGLGYSRRTLGAVQEDEKTRMPI